MEGTSTVSTSYGFVSTYPPTQCGLATFTASLFGELVRGSGDDGLVVRLVETPQRRPAPEVKAQLVAGDSVSMRSATAALNGCDVAIVQHEFGIYGGPDGSEVLQFLDMLQIPCVVIIHTVLTTPTAHQRAVLEAVLAKADAVVVMSATARDRLAVGYAVDMGTVHVIPHGTPDAHARAVSAPMFRTGQPMVLSWGLLGPGKGIEWGIEAFASLTGLEPAPRYVIAGQTHPKVLAREGEAYRMRLNAQVRRLGLGASVQFEGHYRDAMSLAALVRQANVVLLPYDSTEQVTSGVLIEAVAAGKPVVATRFPHAVELLGGGAGLLVPHQDPSALADALRTVLTRADLAAGMACAAAATAEQARWPAVAARYRDISSQLVRAGVAA
jgi:glycosyltransferase involved in cell wall biosynthesis